MSSTDPPSDPQNSDTSADTAQPSPEPNPKPNPASEPPPSRRDQAQRTVADLVVAFIDAFRFLTRLKFPEAICPPGATDCKTGQPARAPHPLCMVMFPVVGLFLGIMVWAGCWLAGLILPRPTTDLLALVVLAVVTGGMQWDGLMDAADALGASPERRMEVMQDVHVGSYAMLALVFTAGTMWGVLTGLDGWLHGAALILFPMWGRWMVLSVSYELKDLRSGEGVSGAFLAEMSSKQMLAATGFCLVVTLLLLGLWGMLLLLLGMSVTSVVLRRVAKRGFGGISADLMSAGGGLGEVSALLMFAVLGQLA